MNVSDDLPRPEPSPRSAVYLGGTVALAGAVLAGVLAVIGVLQQDADAAGLVLGVAMFASTFLSLGTIACALGCLARRRFELVSLVAIAVAAGAVVAIGIGIVGTIEGDGYGRFVVSLETWSFFLLLVLALALAAPPRGMLSALLFGVTTFAFAVAAILITRLIFSDGEGLSVVPVDVGVDLDGADLRIIGVFLAIGAAGWSATLAASRMEKALRTAS